MTTGLDETLRLHQIDGVHNPKIQSVAFERFPIHRSALTIDGNSVVLTSKKPWFKIYDMLTGNTTHVPAIKGKIGRILCLILLSLLCVCVLYVTCIFSYPHPFFPFPPSS